MFITTFINHYNRISYLGVNLTILTPPAGATASVKLSLDLSEGKDFESPKRSRTSYSVPAFASCIKSDTLCDI